MALFISAVECISCGDCEPVCPTDSISEGTHTFTINAGSCTECEGTHDQPQCVKVCPIDGCILPLPA